MVKIIPKHHMILYLKMEAEYFMKQLVLLAGILIFLFSSCGKQKNQNLAQNYYKLALLELTDTTQSGHACKKALSLIDQALSYDQKPYYYALKATLLLKLNQWTEGELYFKKALNQTDDLQLKTEIMNNYACLLAQSKRIDEARAFWQQLEVSKDYLTPEVACVNQGKLAIENKDFKKAQTHFLKAITLAPDYLDAHYYAALTAYQLKDQAFACNEVKTILFLEPQHEGAQVLAEALHIAVSDVSR